MADFAPSWEVEGSISPMESVSGMLKVIEEKGGDASGAFWCWNGRVSSLQMLPTFVLLRLTHDK